ncbi:hypothetical protein MKX03_034821 [Papaver bracteatum]|nr:hypothetical protein MKX03_034821 [Papaver bracteatum]
MDDSGAILCQISSLKDMLDHVNEEIEANIQSTREIESEIAKCSEIETSLAMKESELMKMKLVADFEINSLIQVSAVAKSSVELLEKELSCLRMKLQESNKIITDRRETFIMRCNNFQSRISNGENEELLKLLKEKESLQSEKSNLNMKHNSLRNSTSAFAEEILEELHNSNMALQVEIQLGNVENEKLLEDIDILKRSIVSLFENHLQ